MERIVNISKPVVINTEITPLDELFWIQASGSLQQWHDTNNDIYIPNRKLSGNTLSLLPKLNLYDSQENKVYYSETSDTSKKVTFQSIKWYLVNFNGSDTKIQSTSSSNDFYIGSGNSGYLYVKKNVSDTYYGVVLRCEVTYIDPRYEGSTSKITGYVHLTVNTVGQVLFPQLAIDAPNYIVYNPLGDKFYEGMNKSKRNNYMFDVSASLISEEDTSGYFFKWYCSIDGGEMIEDVNQPCFLGAQPVDTPTVENTNKRTIDARFGEITRVKVQLFQRPTIEGGTIVELPVYKTFTIRTEIPQIDVIVSCDQGNVVRSVGKNYKFSPIINTKNGLLSIDDWRVSQNLRFRWFKRVQVKNGVKSDLGCFPSIGINSNELITRNNYKNGSMQVWCDVLFCGTFQKVTHKVRENNKEVTKEVCWFESSEPFVMVIEGEEQEVDIEKKINEYIDKGQNFYYSDYFAEGNPEVYAVWGKSLEQG